MLRDNEYIRNNMIVNSEYVWPHLIALLPDEQRDNVHWSR
jgi:hypothetical protein